MKIRGINIRNEFAVIGGIILLMLIYLFIPKNNSVNYSLPTLPSLKTERIYTIKVTKAGSTIELIKESTGRWKITTSNSSQSFTADLDKINAMTGALVSFQLNKLISSKKQDQTIYELDVDNSTRVTALDGKGKILREFTFGKIADTYSHTFVSIKGNNNVYLAVGNLPDIFNQTPDALRDKVILSFNEDDVKEFEIAKEDKAIKVIKVETPVNVEDTDKKAAADKPSVKITWKTSDGDELSTDTINRFLMSIAEVRCDSFMDTKIKSEEQPYITIFIKAKKDLRLVLFLKEEKGYPGSAVAAEDDFILSEYLVNKIIQGIENVFAARTGDSKTTSSDAAP